MCDWCDRRNATRYFIIYFFLGLVLIFLIYSPVVNGYFLSEDYAWWNYVKGRNFFEVLPYFIASPAKALAGYYHPLVGLFYWLNVNFSWLKPQFFHLTNFVIHLDVYLLVVATAHFFFKKNLPALLAGFLFLIFPFHSEAVAWIDGRHDLLTTFFYLLSFYLFLRWNEREKKERGVCFILSVLAFFLALAAKEMAITLPVALVVYLWFSCKGDRGNKGDKGKRVFIQTSWHWLVLIVYFFLHAAYVGHWNPFGAASHLGITITRVSKFYLIFLIISIGIFTLAKKLKFGDKNLLHLIPLLAVLIGIFYFPAAFSFTQERYLYLPSTMASIFAAGVFSLCFGIREIRGIRVVKGGLVLGLVVAVWFSLGHLVSRVNDWQKTSEIAQKTIEDFQVYAQKIPEESTLYFFNLPDNYRGNYLFRTHAAEAFKYGSGKSFQKIVVLPRTLGTGDSTIEVVDEKNMILKNENGFLIFSPEITQNLPSGEKMIETEDYYLLVKDQYILELSLKGDYLGKDNVWFFDYKMGGFEKLE